ncbi:MAG: accessory factor UbiK family protein [Betaproteobacteria bacterium]|nr:accessory factor UbiK family protein [Betaproteobacteria bacterium]
MAAKASELLKDSPAADLERNVREYVIAQLAQQGLVTREAFDIQVALLEAAQAKLKELEARVTELEQALNSGGGTPSDD